MSELINQIFEDYLAQNADKDPISFEPLIKQYPEHRNLLQKKIKAYQKIVGTLSDEDEEKPTPQLGRIIGGCTLIKVLGQGGMGIVYLARQEKLNREVVVKVLRPFAIDNEALKERFLRESRIIGRLNHKNIVPVYDVGEEEGSFYIIMKYVPGIPLNKFIESLADKNRSTLKISDVAESMAKLLESILAKTIFLDGKTPTEFFCNLIIKVAEAVQYAHDNGVIHRDIKPSNIIIEPNGNPILLDFGLSHDEVEKNLTVTGEYLGTPIYSAPETFLKNQIYDNKQLDVYSLGVTLYELLTGKLPYEGESVYEIYSNIKSKEPIGPQKKWRNIPSDLEIVLITSIAKDQEHRYQTIERFKNDLSNFLSYLPIQAKKPSHIYRTKIWLKRKKKEVVVICLVLVSILCGFVLFNKTLTIKNVELEEERLKPVFHMAVESLYSNDYKTALREMKKIYELNPDNSMVAVWYYGIKVKQDDNFEEFKDAILTLEKKHPQDLYVKLAKIVIYHEEKDYKHEEVEKQFIFKNLKDEMMWKRIPIYLNSLGVHEPLTLDFLKFALTKYPKDADLNFLMSVFCEKYLKNNNCHKEYLRNAAVSSTRYITLLSDAYSKLPATSMELKDMIRELEEMKLKSLSNLKPNFYKSIGLLYYRSGNCRAALESINVAINLDPEESDYIEEKENLQRKCKK